MPLRFVRPVMVASLVVAGANGISGAKRPNRAAQSDNQRPGRRAGLARPRREHADAVVGADRSAQPAERPGRAAQLAPVGASHGAEDGAPTPSSWTAPASAAWSARRAGRESRWGRASASASRRAPSLRSWSPTCTSGSVWSAAADALAVSVVKDGTTMVPLKCTITGATSEPTEHDCPLSFHGARRRRFRSLTYLARPAAARSRHLRGGALVRMERPARCTHCDRNSRRRTRSNRPSALVGARSRETTRRIVGSPRRLWQGPVGLEKCHGRGVGGKFYGDRRRHVPARPRSCRRDARRQLLDHPRPS